MTAQNEADAMAKWNATADEYNKWDQLGQDERDESISECVKKGTHNIPKTMKPKSTRQPQAEIDLMRVMYAYRQPLNRRRHITTGAVATIATIVSVLVLIASAYVLTR